MSSEPGLLHAVILAGGGGVCEERRIETYFDEAARLFQQASELSGYREAALSGFSDPDVAVAAQNVRAAMGLGASDPVLNVVRALERLGIGVVLNLVDVTDGASQHSGVSRPSPSVDRPLVATVGDLPSAVVRMTLLHELGHLIFDRNRLTPITKRQAPEEKRAFRFAASVLVPDAVVRRHVSESLTLQGYLPLKAKYGMSVSALIVQAAALKVISAARQRSLFIQLSSLGWRRHEPVAVTEETPILLRQASERGISPDARVISQQTGVRRDLVERWTGMSSSERPSGLADIIELRPRKLPGHSRACDVHGFGQVRALWRVRHDQSMSSEPGLLHAVILAGGGGERLGGASKADLMIGGRRLVDVVICGLRPQITGRMVLVAKPTVEPPAGVLRTLERPPDGGPLAGIAAGIAQLADDSRLAGIQDGRVIVTAVDSPGIVQLAPRLDHALSVADSDVGGVVAFGGEPEPFRQYLQAIYLLPMLRRLFAEASQLRDRGVGRTLCAMHLAELPVAPDECRDIDTPEDLDWWRSRLAGVPGLS